jgi:hypothetical protein
MIQGTHQAGGIPSTSQKRKDNACSEITENQITNVGDENRLAKKSRKSREQPEGRQSEKEDWPEYFHSVSLF